MRRRATRPTQLDDAQWLADQYAIKSAAQIARDLDINPQMAVVALERHGISRRSSEEEQRRHHPLLHDRNALEAAIASTSVRDVASELGVTIVAVQVALARQGGQSVHRFNGRTPMTSPDETSLVGLWELEGTLKGVARRTVVSVDTAAIWLARIGIFVSDDPAITHAELLAAIKRGESIDRIRRAHRVADRTVVIELLRHGLHDAHRRRHMQH